MLATRDFQLGKSEPALKWLERVSSLRPNDVANLEFLGDLYLKLEDPTKSVTLMRQALELSHGSIPSITLYINLAEAHRLTGDYSAALETTMAGLVHHPNAVELHNSVGVCRSAMGETSAAIAAYRRAIEIQPYTADANFNLGYTLLEQGDETNGIAAIRNSLKQQPTFGKALTFLGQYELTSGDMNEARRLLERLYDAYWGIPDARKLWADWHFKAGALASAHDESEAERLYRAGLKIDETFGELHLGLGALLVAQNRIPDAIKSLSVFRRLSPDDPRGFLYLGQAYLASGQKDEARQHLQIGLEIATTTGLNATATRCRELLQSL